MHASDLGRGLGLMLLLGGSACRSDPAPSKVDDPSALVSAQAREKSDTPFINPETDPPGPRAGAQLEPAALEAALAEAEALLAKGELAPALVRLQRCVNHTPPSPVCEGTYAATLLDHRKQRAWARHFLHEAVTLADASVSDALLRRLGKSAANNARFDDAAQAFELLVGRGQATADDHVDLAHALQADETRKPQALEILDKAYALAPTRHDLLLERAVLTARIDREAAIKLFEQYKTAMVGDATQVATADRRIESLRREIAGVQPAD